MSEDESTISTDELLAAITETSAPLPRKERSILELGRRLSTEADLLQELAGVAGDPANRVRPPAMPSVSLAHLAAVAMIMSGNVEAAQIARQIVRDWTEDERADLDWYLKALGGSGCEVPLSSGAGSMRGGRLVDSGDRRRTPIPLILRRAEARR